MLTVKKLELNKEKQAEFSALLFALFLISLASTLTLLTEHNLTLTLLYEKLLTILPDNLATIALFLAVSQIVFKPVFQTSEIDQCLERQQASSITARIKTAAKQANLSAYIADISLIISFLLVLLINHYVLPYMENVGSLISIVAFFIPYIAKKLKTH